MKNLATTTRQGVKCGNRKAHASGEPEYHQSAEAVRICYQAGPAYVGPAEHTSLIVGPRLGPVVDQAPAVREERVSVTPRRSTLHGASDFASIPVYTHGHGFYALPSDDGFDFYRVERPTEGKWAGYTFVKRQSSDDFDRIPMGEQLRVLVRIAADPATAATAYGVEIGQCYRCNRTLTSEWRALGIGPDCAAKEGVSLPSKSAARSTAEACGCDARNHVVCHTHRAADAHNLRDLHRAYND